MMPKKYGKKLNLFKSLYYLRIIESNIKHIEEFHPRANNINIQKKIKMVQLKYELAIFLMLSP